MAAPSLLSKPGDLPLRQYEITDPLAPGAKVNIRVTPGNIIYISEASHATFDLLLNDKVRIKGRLARGYIFPDGFNVEKVTVINRHASSALTCLIEVGRARPLDEGLNVYTEQITPTVREENPSSLSFVSVVCTGVGNSLPLLPLDCGRKYAQLFTSAGGEAYFGPDATATWPTVDGNRVGLSLVNAQTHYESCAALYVRGAVGTTVYAYVHGY
jgi:hypothetical protein